MSTPATTPRPPYYAVIFTSLRNEQATARSERGVEPAVDDGYAAMADRMAELGSQQPGFLGLESARGPDGLGITTSYWQSLEDIAHWKNVAEHLLAQRLGRDRWYRTYTLRVARVEDDWSFERPR